MNERICLGSEDQIEIDVAKLVKEGRTPQVHKDWLGGPFCTIPPEGAAPDEELLNAQVGLYESGYGQIILLDPQQVENLEAAIQEDSEKIVS